jgi:tRNA-dihydrouridine synthase B
MFIGPYEISSGAMLAPMAGITNPPFRQICRELGASLTVTELISSHALTFLKKKPSLKRKTVGIKTLALTERFPGENPFAVQIFGRDPDQMTEAARILEADGADIIDLNFGCPARKVVKNGRGAGAALLLDPPLLQEIANRVVRAVAIPVTAKIRLGWDPDHVCAPDIAKRLEDVGTKAICVHARTRDQVHSGEVNFHALASTCRVVDIPVIGNGGISSPGDAKEMMERTGCRRVAIGQACKGNPWIFREILNIETQSALGDRIDLFKRHLTLYVKWAGEPRAVREMRKHACWYFKGFSGAAELRRRLSIASDMSAFLGLLDEINTKR